MAGSVEVFVVVWSQYITLKLFWRTLENYASQEAFLKNFVILVFWNNYSPFVWFFILTKTWPGIRKLVFLLHEELHKKFAAVLKVWQRWCDK